MDEPSTRQNGHRRSIEARGGRISRRAISRRTNGHTSRRAHGRISQGGSVAGATPTAYYAAHSYVGSCCWPPQPVGYCRVDYNSACDLEEPQPGYASDAPADAHSPEPLPSMLKAGCESGLVVAGLLLSAIGYRIRTHRLYAHSRGEDTRSRAILSPCERARGTIASAHSQRICHGLARCFNKLTHRLPPR